jgi:hypothetical protein
VGRVVYEEMSLKLLRPLDEEGSKAEDIGVQWDRYLSVFEHVKWGLGAMYNEKFRDLVKPRGVIESMMEAARKYKEDHPIRPRKDQRILNKDGQNELLLELSCPEERVVDNVSDRVKRRKLAIEGNEEVEAMTHNDEVYKELRKENRATFEEKQREQFKQVYENHKARENGDDCRCDVCRKYRSNDGRMY